MMTILWSVVIALCMLTVAYTQPTCTEPEMRSSLSPECRPLLNITNIININDFCDGNCFSEFYCIMMKCNFTDEANTLQLVCAKDVMNQRCYNKLVATNSTTLNNLDTTCFGVMRKYCNDTQCRNAVRDFGCCAQAGFTDNQFEQCGVKQCTKREPTCGSRNVSPRSIIMFVALTTFTILLY